MEKKGKLDVTKVCLIIILLVFMFLITFAIKNINKTTVKGEMSSVNETKLNHISQDNEIEAINLRIGFLKNLLNSSEKEEMLYDSMRGSIITRQVAEKEILSLQEQLENLENQ